MTTCTVGGAAPRSNIRIVGCDGGEVFHILGDGAGTQGVEIVDGGMDGLIEANVTVLERTPVRMDGAILRAVKTTVMEVTLELSVSSLWVDESFGEVDGRLREAFSYELDPWNPDSTLARIEWETHEDLRWIEVVLTAGTTWQVDRDPHRRGWWLLTLKLKAYVPFWQAEPRIEPVTFEVAGSKPVPVDNPTGVPMHHILSGTVAQWRVSDNTWSGRRWERSPGGRFPNRTLLYPNLTSTHGGIVIDYTPGKIPVRDKHDTNLVAQMPVPGDYPKFSLPPFMQEQTITVTAVSVPAGGAAMKVIQPRQYRRPWGRV